MNFYLVLPTKYSSIEDSRYKLFLKTIKTCLHHSYITKVVVVDSSENKVLNHMKILLNNSKIDLIVLKDFSYLKGGGIREGIKYVNDKYGKNNVIVFQEPEKENMIYHYLDILEKYKNEKSYICIPKRVSEAFDSYPIEQQYEEKFLNCYLTKLTGLKIDWSFGPVMFTGDLSEYWLNYDGKLWDAQIIPIYEAMKNDIKIYSEAVCFFYPKSQKEKEEDNLEFIEKRRYQLNYMVEFMIDYMKKGNLKFD